MQAPTLDDIRAGWDRIAPGFDRHDTPHSMKLGEQALDLIEIREGTRFLDVGAGTGALTIPAARRGARVTAIDIAPTMIELLCARAKDDGLDNVEGRVMDGSDLDFPADAFDVSASINGVSLFPDMDGGLAEMVRVTGPGGRVGVVAFGPPQQAEWITYVIAALTAAVPDFAGFPMDPPPLPFQVADPEEMARRLVRAGLEDVRVEHLTWEVRTGPEHPAQDLWDAFTHSNPIGAQMVAALSPEQEHEVKRVLAGMLRERSEDDGTTPLTTAINVGLGEVPA